MENFPSIPAPGAPLLKVDNLQLYFPVRGGILRRQVATSKAVDGVSLTLNKGETLGIIGESGCGKTTLGKSIVRLLKPTGGSIAFQGGDITWQSAAALKPVRREIQMIFQDPAESLNPRHTVGDIIAEPLIVQRWGTKSEREAKVGDLLEKVGMPRSAAHKYSFEFSGGQRQRIGIARAIALNPQLVVCDEPVSALDVSVQSQVLNLLMDLQRDLGLSYLFISHNLAVVKHVSDRIAIMYLGKIMEMGPSEQVYRQPRHAYTKALISAIPHPDPTHRGQRILLQGDLPSPINPPPGCAFGHRTNSPRYQESIGHPIPLIEVAPGHFVAKCPCCVD